MIWVFLLGAFLGFVFATWANNASAQKPKARKNHKIPNTIIHHNLPPNPYGNPPPIHIRYSLPNLEIGWQRRRRIRELTRLARNSRNGKLLVENWRKSVVGLMKLAEQKLAAARQHLIARDYERAIQAASASVENISRALIHCFGEKPLPGSGQEEVLRMLVKRFKGDERGEFEKAVDAVSHIDQNKMALNYLSTRNVHNQLFDGIKARQIIESASRIVGLFKHIITERFITELPELEVCPKCHSMNIAVWGFTEEGARYNCQNCRHKWTEPRV